MGLLLTLTGLLLSAQPPRAPAAAASLPFVGSGSTKTADKIALRRMLFDRRFAELTSTLEGLQALSDADCDQELIGIDAFEAFYCAEPNVPSLFDDWVKTSPDSFAPLVARGTWYFAMSEAGRGYAFARQTSEAQWKTMEALAPLAKADLEASIAKHPTFAARRMLINLNRMTSTPEAQGDGQLELLLKQCPTSLQAHLLGIKSLAPRWGGSYEGFFRLSHGSPGRGLGRRSGRRSQSCSAPCSGSRTPAS